MTEALCGGRWAGRVVPMQGQPIGKESPWKDSELGMEVPTLLQ